MKKTFLIILFILSFSYIYAEDIVVTDPSDYMEGSLREAVSSANNGDRIIFDIKNLSSKTINIEGKLVIYKKITIDGINIATGDTLTLKQVSPNTGVINIPTAYSNDIRFVNIQNLKITNGTNGGIYVGCYINLTLSNCSITQNSSYAGSQGGIFVSNKSSLMIDRCIISGNSSSDSGGILSYYSDVRIKKSHIFSNYSTFNAAGITIVGGSLDIEDSKIDSNSVKGVQLIYASMKMRRCVIDKNSHSGGGWGGAISGFAKTDLYIEDSKITNNLAGDGGAIWAVNNLTLKRVEVKNNTSIATGGGIYFSGDSLSIDSCLIDNNSGYNGAGGLSLWSGNHVEVTNSTISNNVVTNYASRYPGGGIMADCNFKMSGCSIYGNKASYGAGVSYINRNGKIELSNNTFYNNIAETKGGAIHIILIYGTLKDGRDYLPTYPKAELFNNTIANNQAAEGGGIYFESNLYSSGYGEFSLYNNLIASNSNSDFVRYDKNQTAITYFKGKSNIGLYKGANSNMDAVFLSYNSSSKIFRDNTLADNGGYTKTMAIDDESIAKAKGVYNITDNAIPTIDQRGCTRKMPPCIGSFELTSADILPSISEQPKGAEVYANNVASLNVKAEGENLKYQWYKDNIKLENKNASTLTINKIKYSDSGEYQCSVRSYRGEVLSDKAKLSVLLKSVQIVTQPHAVKTSINQNVLLSVEATGDELVYQWFKNGEAIKDANSMEFTLSNTKLEDTGEYYCSIKNATSDATSEKVEINIFDNASLESMSIDNQAWSLDNKYIIPSNNISNTLEIQLIPYDSTSKVYYNNAYIQNNKLDIDISKPCLKEIGFEIRSSDLTNTRSYKVLIEKYFDFDALVTMRWNNTLTVINNPELNGGFNFVAYKWFKNDTEIGTKQFYSAGSQKTDLLDSDAKYYVQVTTEDGQVLRTTDKQLSLNNISVKAYPTLISKGETVSVEIDMDEVYFNGNDTSIEVFNTKGNNVGRYLVKGRTTQVSLPAISDLYIINIKSNNFTNSLKVVVK